MNEFVSRNYYMVRGNKSLNLMNVGLDQKYSEGLLYLKYCL